jgi:hypothetical protein
VVSLVNVISSGAGFGRAYWRNDKNFVKSSVSPKAASSLDYSQLRRHDKQPQIFEVSAKEIAILVLTYKLAQS